MDEKRCWSTAILLLIAALLISVDLIGAIQCVQCDRATNRLQTNRTNRTSIQDCLVGRTAAAPCPNASHTHCITSYYRQLHGSNDAITVMWRKCGTAADIGHCSRYTFRRPITTKRRSHISLDSASQHRLRHSKHNHRRDGRARNRVPSVPEYDLIEVCSQGCDRDRCLIAATAAQSAADATIRRRYEMMLTVTVTALLRCCA